MNIRLQQLNPTIGDIRGNVSLIKEAVSQAGDDEIDLLVLPELVVCGYPPMDLLERRAFLERVYEANKKIAEFVKETAVLFGTATQNTSEFGRKCFNSALFVKHGKVLAEVHKTLLPTYDVYDELRYFEPNRTFECIEFKDRKLGITVCEDIWHNFELPYLSYEIDPAEKLVELGAEAIFNVSASPYTKNKPDGRLRMLQRHARNLEVPIFYSNQVGGNTELISDGDSMAIDSRAGVVARAPLFEVGFVDLEWNPDEDSVCKTSPGSNELPSKTEQMFRGLVLGLRDYLRKTGVSDKVVVGISGGIDSALVTCIAVEALGKDKVVGITMPSEFSSEGSVNDSQKLADNLGIKLYRSKIKDIYEQFRDTLSPLFENTAFGVAEENIQTRIRGILLMAYSNKFGNMLLNTGNKSELATGYCTLYGDMTGGLGIISDLYKTQVYEMVHWLNNEYFKQEVVPVEILSKPPSAELRPGQKDTDKLPDYEILDPILKAYIEEQLSVDEIANRGFDLSMVERVTTMVDQSEYKRFQAVPGLKLSDKAFGTGRRWPIVQRWTDNRD
jgi:NAD+ synthetase